MVLRGPADRLSGVRQVAGGDGVAECVAFLAAGVDGLFTDHPDTAVAARDLTDPGQTMRWSS